MGYHFYRQQMEHFKVKTITEFLNNFKKPVKVSKQDLVDAIIDITNVDCGKMTVVQLQTLLSSLMVYEPKGILPFEFTGSKPSKLQWQKYMELYLGVDYNSFKNLTIDTMHQLKGFLQQ